MDEAQSFARASRATSTLRAYASDWADFDRFCVEHGLSALPADPGTVALYLTDLAHSHRPSTLTRRTAAISIEHKRRGLASPTADPRVGEILRGIRRTLGTATKEAAPLGIGEVRRVVAHLPDSLAGARDRALLLVGFASAMRGSELVALNVEDIERRDEGLVLVQRRGKTDQEGVSARRAIPWGRDQQTCPVSALDAWLARSEIVQGAVFRGVTRHDKIGSDRLSQRGVTLVVKRATSDAGLDPTAFTSHSLRAGFCTTAAAAGASERAIANQSGHRDMQTLRKYVRHGTVFIDNAVSALGL